MTRTLAALVLALVLPSCWIARTQTNLPADPVVLATLEPGTTTAAEVVSLLGAPTEVVQLGKRSAYRYQHAVSKGASLWLGVIFLQNRDTQYDRVWIWFDESNVVTHAAATFDSDETEYALPWMHRD